MKKLIFSLITSLMITSLSFANSIATDKTNASKFLGKYYSSYSLGKSIETKVDEQNIIVSEVLNKESGVINGYIAINKNNDEILYFVDYLRDTQEIKAIDFKNNTTDIVNFKKGSNFENFVKLDLIEEIEKINSDPSSVMKFWGTSCGSGWSTPTGECYKTCCYYVFWASTGCDIVGC